jgi:PST family polysaccharide transporter
MLNQQSRQPENMSPTVATMRGSSSASEPDSHFRTDHLQDDLAGRAMRGGMLTLIAQVLKFLISTSAMIIVARLLTPRDYGLVGMVVIVISFFGMFQYLGLPAATIRWKELTQAQVSNLFWVNVALSTTIMLAVLACAPLLAWFYKEPRLVGIAAGYAFFIFLTGLSIQHLALLQRQMRFVALAVLDLGAVTIGLIVTIIAAWRGAGYWALVINQLVFSSLTIVGAWTVCRWRPSLPARNSGVRSMLAFGGNLTGHNIATFFAQNSDNALIGKFWGAYQLGIYSRAYQMLLTPIGQVIMPLSAVAVPALSRLAESPERYRAAYLKIVEKIAMLTMPAIVFTIAMSDWVILLLLGRQWGEASRIFMLLGIAAVIQPVSKTGTWLLITQGRSREMLRWGIIGAAIAVASIIVGLPWGATGVAASYAITDLCIGTPLFFWYIGRSGPVRARDVYVTIGPALCAAATSLIVLLLCRHWLETIPHLITRLAIGFVMTIAISLTVLVMLPAGRLAIKGLSETISLLKRRETVA